MADSWQLFSDDAAEQRTFADLAATLALPFAAAGPKNRNRSVRRIATPHGVYFLKVFTRTQWKNRLVFATTAPRARDDAERERRVTEALRAAGHFVPRPVAQGRDGPTSYYLCAALPGRSLLECLRERIDPVLLRGVATHCGQTLAAGFWLPDLSAEHVFVDDEGDQYLLDLHNGRVAPAGPAPAWLLRRVLRHCRRSVRDVAVPAQPALQFAVRLLRAAGCGAASRRRLLAAQAPWATATRYDAPGKSSAYADRNPTRHARELELLHAVWPGRAGESVLDLPCGAGRLLPVLRALDHRVVQADGALAMLQEARRRHDAIAPAVCADARAFPFGDRAVDGVVMFRFLHHLPNDAADLAIGEACRVARRFVVVSFFHPCSLHHLQRRVRGWFGAPPTRFARSLGALRRRFARHGFTLHAQRAQTPFVRDLWLASFVRTLAQPGPSA
ncbi:MAG: methyltransferase domain-containing protein [Planctomycetes bacterium]|nr:methyltransferase domain-containing protein [Planctomycetota bacterium]